VVLGDPEAADGEMKLVSVSVSVDVEGSATVSGLAVLRSQKRLPALLQAASGTAHCADVDGDGLGGLARIEIDFEDVRSGEVVSAIVAPDDGDISTPGSFEGTILFPDLNLSRPVKILLHRAWNSQQ
jgi:hypothetical protein